VSVPLTQNLSHRQFVLTKVIINSENSENLNSVDEDAAAVIIIRLTVMIMAIQCVPKKVSPQTLCNNISKADPVSIKFYTQKTTSVTNITT